MLIKNGNLDKNKYVFNKLNIIKNNKMKLATLDTFWHFFFFLNHPPKTLHVVMKRSGLSQLYVQ